MNDQTRRSISAGITRSHRSRTSCRTVRAPTKVRRRARRRIAGGGRA
jgi:hypothetical protein